MSKEKQIEEMKKDLAPIMSSYGQHWRTVFLVHDLIELGYRKQSEGEWGIIKIGDGGTTRTCSNCLISQTVNVYNGKVMFKYCPYCGAKMKGV